MGVTRRLDRDEAVLVEQRGRVGQQDREARPVRESDPARLVGQRVSAHRGRHVERRAHAGADLAVPAAGGLGGVRPRPAPQAQLHLVGAAVVAARDERPPRPRDRRERGGRIAGPPHARRIGPRPDDDEIVVHHRSAGAAEPGRDERAFGRRVMDQEDIGVAPPGKPDRLAGADGDHPHVERQRRPDPRQQPVIETGIAHRSRRGEGENVGFGPRLRRDEGERQRQYRRDPGRTYQNRSPARKARAASLRGPAKKDAAGPCSNTRPRCMNSTSSAIRRAWPRSCVVMTILVPER